MAREVNDYNVLKVSDSEILFACDEISLVQFHHGRSVLVQPAADCSQATNKFRIFHTLNQLVRNNGGPNGFTDLIVKDDFHAYRIHSMVLLANSPRYKKMYLGPEATASTPFADVVLKGIGAKGALGCVLNCLYTGQLQTTGDTVRDVLEICEQLDLPSIRTECIHFLSCFDVNKVLFFLPIAIDYQLDSLVKMMALHSRKYCDLVMGTKEFLGIDEDCLQAIVSNQSDGFNDDQLLQYVLKWICHKKEDRAVKATTLLTKICFKRIPASKIAHVLETYPDLFQSEECQEKIYEAFRYHALKAVENGYKVKTINWKSALL